MADNTIALQAQAPDSFKGIGSILNFANAAQQYQANALALEKARQTFESDVAQRKSESSRSGTEARVSAETADPRIAAQKAATGTAQIGEQAAQFKLQGEQSARAMQLAGGLFKDPRIKSGTPAEQIEAVDEVLGNMIASGIPKTTAQWYASQLISKAHQPGAIFNALQNMIQANAGAGTQAGVLNAPLQGVGTPQGAVMLQTQPGAPNAVQPGTFVQSGLAPTTQVLGPNNQTGIVGPQGAPAIIQPNAKPAWMGPEPTGAFRGNPDSIQRSINAIADPQERELAQRAFDNQRGTPSQPQAAPQTGFIPTQPAPGVVTAAETAARVAPNAMDQDYKQVLTNAESAKQNIGTLQNIKKYAAGAVTGVVQDRREFMAGLAGLLGMDVEQAQKTSTDLLAKSSNMLALTGGNTDAARALAEAMNPNKKMTKEAINEAADIVVSQQEMRILKQQYMSRFVGDAGEYNRRLAEFNDFADARALQLKNMTPDQKRKMKEAMTPAEEEKFRSDMRKMRAYGLL